MSSRRTCQPVGAATARFPIRQSFVRSSPSQPPTNSQHPLLAFSSFSLPLVLIYHGSAVFIINLSVYSHWYIHNHARVHRFSCIHSFSSAQPPNLLLRQTAVYRIHSIIMGICSSCLGNRRRDYNDVRLICFQPLLRGRGSTCAICDHGQHRTIKKLYN